MGFLNDLLRGASRSMANQPPPTIDRIAEMQRRKDLQDEIQRQTQQQAFVNMMKQQEMEYGQQRDAIGDQQWQKTFDTNKYFNEQQGINSLTNDMNTYTNNLADNARADKELQWKMSGGDQNGGGGNQQTQAFWAWYNAQPPEIQDEVMRTQAGLSPKAGTIRQPKPVDPIARLSYGTEHASKVMGQRPDLMDSPNSFDSLRNIGMQEYDAAQAGAQGVSPEEEQALIQRESSIDQIIATMKQRLGIQ